MRNKPQSMDHFSQAWQGRPGRPDSPCRGAHPQGVVWRARVLRDQGLGWGRFCVLFTTGRGWVGEVAARMKSRTVDGLSGLAGQCGVDLALSRRPLRGHSA